MTNLDREYMDLVTNCPDCGEFLWDELLGTIGDWRNCCDKCGYPAADFILEVQSDGTTKIILDGE